MNRAQIVEFINTHNVGSDRGAGLIASLELLINQVVNAERDQVKAKCKKAAKTAWNTNRDEYGRAQANALQNFADEL